MTDSPPILLDQIDRDLIAHLRNDGRAPVSKLADMLGLARATVQSRIDRLMAQGVLLGFSARIREDVEEGSIRALMMIEVAGKATARVIKILRGWPEIRALYSTNGRWDLVAEIVTPDLPGFDRVLREVRMVDGIEASETSLLLSRL